MKKIITWMLAALLMLTLAAAAFADSPFRVEDGFVVGTYEKEGFIEVYVNGVGAGAGMNSVEVKSPSKGDGEDDIQIYVDGSLQTAFVNGEEVPPEEYDSLVEVEQAEILEAPESFPPIPTAEPTEEPAVEEPQDTPDAAVREGAAEPTAEAEPSEPDSTGTTDDGGPAAARSGVSPVLWIVIAVVVVAAAIVILLRSKKHAK